MTKAATAKLLILVALTFIICVPEFFRPHRDLKVNLLCAPHRLPEDGAGMSGEAEESAEAACDPCVTPRSDDRAPRCTRGRRGKGSGSEEGAPRVDRFTCETDTDVTHLSGNYVLSDPGVVQVSIEVHLEGSSPPNFTLYGHFNHSSLRLDLPVEMMEEEGEEEEAGVDEEQWAFYCCLPASAMPTNHSRCLLLLTNRTLPAEATKEEPPWKGTWNKDEWWSVFKVLWLSLLGVGLLVGLSTALVHWVRRTEKNRAVTFDGHYKGSRFSGVCTYLPLLAVSGPSLGNLPGMVPHRVGSRYQTGLSPIQEVDYQIRDDSPPDGDLDFQAASTEAVTRGTGLRERDLHTGAE